MLSPRLSPKPLVKRYLKLCKKARERETKGFALNKGSGKMKRSAIGKLRDFF
jgi:hypothetical protein